MVFVRTAGCNLRCSYCDTTYAYETGKEMSLEEILQQTRRFTCTSVCITGGEPLIQPELVNLIKIFLEAQYRICIETNGSRSVQDLAGKKSLMLSLDIKCPSSGMHQHMNFNNIPLLSSSDQLKFVVQQRDDYEYAKQIITSYKPRCLIYLQPVWGTDPKKLASWILQDGLPVRFGMQLQKLLWGEKKGV